MILSAAGLSLICKKPTIEERDLSQLAELTVFETVVGVLDSDEGAPLPA